MRQSLSDFGPHTLPVISFIIIRAPVRGKHDRLSVRKSDYFHGGLVQALVQPCYNSRHFLSMASSRNPLQRKISRIGDLLASGKRWIQGLKLCFKVLFTFTSLSCVSLCSLALFPPGGISSRGICYIPQHWWRRLNGSFRTRLIIQKEGRASLLWLP